MPSIISTREEARPPRHGIAHLKTIDVPPNASALVESMRDIGYTLGTALADLIDNCLTAGARNIRILADTSAPSPVLGILDDGTGMDKITLINAMRLGTQSPQEERDHNDLGRFGLGLKTASFSQCRKLTVLTKQAQGANCAQWDLDYVVKTNQWRVRIPERIETIPWAEELDGTGTLILWENLTIIDSSADSEEEFVHQLDEARSHLELVFHRYLTGERGVGSVHISLNGRPLEPFDPFNSRHPATIIGAAERILFEGQEIVVVAYTLPHHSKVNLTEWEQYAGKEGYLRNQGFYIYRERRLIFHGSWFGLIKQTELTKLTRVRIDMPNALDAAWKIDIKKSSAQLPGAVRKHLRNIIDPLVTGSKRIYKSRGRKLTQDSLVPVWNRIQDNSEIRYRVNLQHPLIEGLLSTLDAETQDDLLRLLEVVGSSLPMDAIFADIAEISNQHGNASMSVDALAQAAEITYRYLTASKHYSDDDAKTIMQRAEPFRSNWERTLAILHATANDSALQG